MSNLKVQTSRRDLQVRVYEAVARFTGVVELAATDIFRQASDAETKRRAARWVSNAVPQMQWAALREDPLVGLLNGWIFSLQMLEYFARGAGHDRFGDYQAAAVTAARKGKQTFETLAASLLNDEVLTEARSAINQYASSHPLTNPLFVRESPDALVAAQASKVSGGIRATAEMNEQMRDLNDRLSLYTLTIPRQVTWEAGLLMNEAFDQFRTERDALIETMRAESHSLISDASAEARNEIQAILEYLTSERKAVSQLFRSEREAVMSTLRQERIETMEQAERIADATARDAIREMRPVAIAAIDHAFWRGAQLGSVALLAVVGFILVGALLIRHERRPRSRPAAHGPDRAD